MPSAAPAPVVHHDTAAKRFSVEVDGAHAVLEYRELDAKTREYHHTFVPNALRGKGVASQLAESALRYARDQDLKIVPTCPFVATYIRRHREFQSLVRQP